MSEKNDYQLLRKHLMGKGVHLERMENMAGVGTPDIYYCIDGTMGWIEMKSPKEPRRESSKLFADNHKLPQSQKNWFLNHRNAGGRGYILICTDKCWMLIDSKDADDINLMTANELFEIAVWRMSKPISQSWWNLLRKKLVE